MLTSTVRRLPWVLLNCGRKTGKAVVCPFCRCFSEKRFSKAHSQLWSDGGSQVFRSTSDNVGGWQENDSLLLNSIDVCSIKHRSLKGFKDVNEDRIQIKELCEGSIFVGVFDGHGGSFVVDFVKDNLHTYVERCLGQSRCPLTTALRRGFIDCDMALAKEIEAGGGESHARSGSTATVVVMRNGEEMVIASVGDSRAILCREGKGLLLTSDHTPASVDEKNRVLASGGSIEWDGNMTARVNGRLAMTRCFGNFDLKPYGVIAVPDIQTVLVNQETENFLALVTDGVSETISTDLTVSILNSSDDAEECVEMLTTCAAQFGSEDDITAVLVPFRSFASREVSDSSNQDFSFFTRFGNHLKYV